MPVLDPLQDSFGDEDGPGAIANVVDLQPVLVLESSKQTCAYEFGSNND